MTPRTFQHIILLRSFLCVVSLFIVFIKDLYLTWTNVMYPQSQP